MRYLNKIVFINSAHVPYAEIKLDGNVHFIGTQGVGKSTLLRAILFFYNVDKGKLGIRTQDKQKSYDEFYFPYPNSYIIYEVCRETGTFFVMTFLSRGRAAFRIVDCPYDRRFFVEEDGSVRYEWGRISEQIGTRVFKSNIIRGYEEFRDILYGNQQSVSRELRRFSLLESMKYQNVPRTIQNIFLNQSLESRVIKDTIIDSMDFAKDDIDLNFYREQVRNFRQQYEDIWKWYKKEKNGRVKVRTEAENVISKYMLYENSRRAIAELCGHLNYAMERDAARLPLLAKEAADCGQELARQKRLLGEEQGKYDAERDKLNREDGALKAFLDEAKRKRRHYADIGIGTIVERMEKEGEKKILLDSLKLQERTLTDRSQGVKQKYDALLQDVENRWHEYKIQAERKQYELDRDGLECEARLRAERDRRQEAVREQCRQKLDENQEKTDEARQMMGELKLSGQKVTQLNPYQDAMDDLEKRAADLQERQHLLERDAAAKQQEIDRVVNDTGLRRKDVENKCEKDIARMEFEIRQVVGDINRCDGLLARQKGSLIEWLGEHVEGWESNLGRVLDRDSVLYSTSLNPRLADVGAADALYGVRLDVEHIERSVETPEEIKRQKAMLEQRKCDWQKQMDQRRVERDTEIAELERKPQLRLKALRMEKVGIDAELNQLPARIQRVRKELDECQARLADWRANERAVLQGKMAKLEEEMENLQRQKSALALQRDKELEGLRKAYDKQFREMARETERKKKTIADESVRRERESAVQKRELRAQCDAELEGLGVDVGRLNNIRRQLQEVTDELAYIESHRRDYISWQNDTKEYFDREQEKKDEQARIRQKLADLQEKFNVRKQKLDREVCRLSDRLRSLQDEQRGLEDAIGRAKGFAASSSCPAELHAAGRVETMRPLADVLEDLRDHIGGLQRRMEEFKQAVTVFKANFSPQNTFHFRTELNADADYAEFAADLNDFLGNKKIEEYRVRTSAQYANIISRIAREVGDLNQHTADIRSTIGDINKDFRENNFAGVIKDIELRAVESNDRLMQQLLNIKKFDEEHGFDIGQLNLFSDADTQGRTNQRAVELLMTLVDLMDAELKRERITLSDTFKLEFKVRENDNDTNWVEKLSSVGSDGTDVLVKAMVNIMLINVFKRKVSRKFGDFKLHCMMDEIGKLHPNNVEGILKFANVRNIYLINSSPTTYNAQAYKYTYMLNKDERNNSVVKTLLTVK